MPEQSIYKDIAERTGGNIYIGVAGPVRTGKSTFIKRFMETLVLPSIRSPEEKIRAQDELPQSAGGKTIMTTEPKFIPEEAVSVTLQDTSFRVRMIDCAGYMVPGAVGSTENNAPRMVHTPWSEQPLPFEEAAELGTHKVITEHATIGILVTTDGSIGDLPREAYTEAEQRAASELQALGKPFVIVLNAAHPETPQARALGIQLEETYHTPVALVSCTQMDAEDIRHILALVLEEFPVREIAVQCPKWLTALPESHPLTASLLGTAAELAKGIQKTGDLDTQIPTAIQNPDITEARILSRDPGTGSAVISLSLKEDLYYQIIEEETGCSVSSDAELLDLLRTLSACKKQYDRVADALNAAAETGYGIVLPEVGELSLAEPEIVRQAAGYGVRLKASAPSIHMIRAGIEAEIAPIIGTEEQAADMVKFLMQEYQEDPARLWETNMLGKSLHALVSEGLSGKLSHMPEDARRKIGETLERIINEGSGGLICILL